MTKKEVCTKCKRKMGLEQEIESKARVLAGLLGYGEDCCSSHDNRRFLRIFEDGSLKVYHQYNIDSSGNPKSLSIKIEYKNEFMFHNEIGLFHKGK